MASPPPGRRDELRRPRRSGDPRRQEPPGRDGGPAEARGDRDTLRDALEAAGELSRLLVCYKFDAGLLRPDIDAHCPAELVDDVLAEVRSLSGLELVADSSLAPQSWYYDESLVRMVLANAVHNALRFARRRIVVSA